MQKRILILSCAILFATRAIAQVEAIDPNRPHREHEHPPSVAAATSGAAGEQEQEKKQYTCPMHPEVVMDHPGNCPKCGMKLVPRKDRKPQGKTEATPSSRATAQHHGAKRCSQHRSNSKPRRARIAFVPCRTYANVDAIVSKHCRPNEPGKLGHGVGAGFHADVWARCSCSARAC